MKNCFCFLGCVVVLIILLIACVVGYFGYIGFVPGISQYFGSDIPKDLGVTYTAEDYVSFMTKSASTVDTSTTSTNPQNSIVFSGSREFKNVTFTQSEVTARVNSIQWIYSPVRDVQVKFNGDGTLEVSGILILDNIVPFLQASGYSVSQEDLDNAIDSLGNIPVNPIFYVEVLPSVADNNAEIAIQKFELGRLSIDVYQYGGEEVLSDLVTKVFTEIEGFYARSVVIDQGTLLFDGTAPTAISVLPASEAVN